MITAIDFGCYEIRSAYRSLSNPKMLTFTNERSEYTMLPAEDSFRDEIIRRKISYAECENSIVVFGNQAEEIQWLSRRPCASLFTNGSVPTDDAPARQILNVLTEAMLPNPDTGTSVCCFTVPDGGPDSNSAQFLSRLIRMKGFLPIHCTATSAANVACGAETGFTGITICMGLEHTEVAISRHGRQLATESLQVGANRIDAEFARRLKITTFDEHGDGYLDLHTVRRWKHDSHLHLRDCRGERERMLAGLYSAAMDSIARCVSNLLKTPRVAAAMPKERLSVYCCGGPAQLGGFAGALTERFVEQGTAERILSVVVVEDAAHAVARGLLILGELQQNGNVRAAA